ncbi:MAG: fused signal recognition particle receptor [Frankiaceae bacterium]|nr:fused signal recognition particle receptor [Frankiaceae bacterium]MDQ1648184.1 fused signal recognition particle receptor [Frankiaceae bacterium]
MAFVAVVGYVVSVPRRRREIAALDVDRTAPSDLDGDPDAQRLPGVGDDAEEPRDTPKRGLDTLSLPGDTDDIVEVPAGPQLDTPDPAAGRLVRLRTRLSRSQNVFGKGLLALLSRDALDEDDWEEIEDTLLTADMGVKPATELVAALRTRVRVLGARTPADVRALLRDELLAQVGTTTDRTLHTRPHLDASDDGKDRPAVVLVVGVNGTGKTTTCGKLARVLVADDHTVLLGAADTFRAAAADQLETWGSRVGASVVRGPEGGDPASVAFETVKRGIAEHVDTVLIDTAGRLHTKSGLMDELGKVKRVVEKHGPVDEVLLVLDATTGQNAVVQARVFTEVVNITGVVLTKLDGTAKGGIVIAVQRELGVPVKLVGLGEGADDLAPFEPEAFVDALLGDPV